MGANLKRRIRRELHYLVADVLYYSGILSLRKFLRRNGGRGNETCILGLHRVLADADASKSASLPGMILRESTFVDLLKYLNEEFRLVSLAEFLESFAAGTPFPRNACLLTFDDGWTDNFTTAFPHLERSGVPALIFLITGLIGTTEIFWVERLSREWRELSRRQEIQSKLRSSGVPEIHSTSLEGIIESLKNMPAAKRDRILSRICPGKPVALKSEPVDRMAGWEAIQTMSRGGVEFGAHTVTHPLLVYEEESVVGREVTESKQVIEARLGAKVRAFAYPNGSWDARVRKCVEKAGFACAFTTERGWHNSSDDPYSINRIMIHDGVLTGRDGRFSRAMLELRLSGWF